MTNAKLKEMDPLTGLHSFMLAVEPNYEKMWAQKQKRINYDNVRENSNKPLMMTRWTNMHMSFGMDSIASLKEIS